MRKGYKILRTNEPSLLHALRNLSPWVVSEGEETNSRAAQSELSLVKQGQGEL